MSNRHKWADVIHAFADGKEIEWRWIVGCVDRPWFDCSNLDGPPFDNIGVEFRIKPHKYQDVIDAYLRGETVQYYCINPDWNSGWLDVVKGKGLDVFDSGHEYRIKPKPDITKTGRIYLDDANQLCWNAYNYPDNVKFTFDGETGKLKEVINLYE